MRQSEFNNYYAACLPYRVLFVYLATRAWEYILINANSVQVHSTVSSYSSFRLLLSLY